METAVGIGVVITLIVGAIAISVMTAPSCGAGEVLVRGAWRMVCVQGR